MEPTVMVIGATLATLEPTYHRVAYIEHFTIAAIADCGRRVERTEARAYVPRDFADEIGLHGCDGCFPTTQAARS